MNVADPTFTLSSDSYYRRLLLKVSHISNGSNNFLFQIYDNSKQKIKKQLEDDKPRKISLGLDGWSQHHHGYIGCIASQYFFKYLSSNENYIIGFLLKFFGDFPREQFLDLFTPPPLKNSAKIITIGKLANCQKNSKCAKVQV